MLESITLHFQALNKLNMGTSLCDVTVTFKRQWKIVHIFFLNQNTFCYKKIYVWHFYQKMHTELHSGLHYFMAKHIQLSPYGMVKLVALPFQTIVNNRL